ncbi:MAG: GNAT family N-acetyltransferase [Jatrophihabitans sp.]
MELSPEQADSALTTGWRGMAHLRDDKVVSISLAPDLVTKPPPLWFVEFHEPGFTPPPVVSALAVHLIAFTGHDQLTGAVLDDAALRVADIAYHDQLAAIRWYPATGEVHQIYVQPAWRRRGVGNALIYATAVLSAARRWARLWGSGVRTEIGEEFRNASTWGYRAAALTEVAPPMTPDASG